MRALLPAALLCFAASPAAAAERGYSITSFDRIRVEGPFAITLATGRPVSARASGSPQALDRVQLRVEGRTLLVRAGPAWGGAPRGDSGPIALTLTTPELSTAILLGSGRLAIDRMRGARLVLTVEGSGGLSVGTLETDTLVMGISGAGRIEAAGRARMANVLARGAADIRAAGLQVVDLVVTSQSAGAVALSATRSARVTASGLGPVEIGGGAACTVAQTGAGPVRCGSD
ncbi:DUF2807 domain-containing protein [Sphingomonas changnyeongensis]|uniref:DUF2807 domain-containing protein n=1 Tax=Sphingomonas changnyeongensis TaxID=2698679 RepID=A0A7Z2NV83_9SPHN|nr:DUF2807 domain-containing protein [Sphingomonas changnyeongensis]QHL90086.1 DUF2807 domain-containing protein [Sphingomonas changnyeongensis]